MRSGRPALSIACCRARREALSNAYGAENGLIDPKLGRSDKIPQPSAAICLEQASETPVFSDKAADF